MSEPDQESPDDATQPGGISAFEFEDLSPAARTVIRLILRNRELADADLRSAIAGLPADEQIAGEDLDAALQSLLRDDHLLQFGDPSRYKVNLRRKHTSTLRRSIWDAIGEEGGQSDERQRERARRRNRVQSVWEMLETPAPRRTLPKFSEPPEERGDEE